MQITTNKIHIFIGPSAGTFCRVTFCRKLLAEGSKAPALAEGHTQTADSHIAILAQDQCGWCSAITAAPWPLAPDLAALQQGELC